MLTIFTVFRPFVGHFDVIQRNAIESWKRLHPDCEILSYADETGVAQAAREYGFDHTPEVARNGHGTPLVSDVFERAQRRARHDLLVFIDGDIILTGGFLRAAERVRRLDRFLAVGRRWDLDLTERLLFASPGWEKSFLTHVRSRASLHHVYGSAYFVFRRDPEIWRMPPLAIGRTRYDNWLIWRARSLGMPIVDITAAAVCVHQNHDRRYTSIGMAPVDGNDDMRAGLEARENERLTQGQFGDLRDVTHHLTPRLGLRRSRKGLLQRLRGAARKLLGR